MSRRTEIEFVLDKKSMINSYRNKKRKWPSIKGWVFISTSYTLLSKISYSVIDSFNMARLVIIALAFLLAAATMTNGQPCYTYCQSGGCCPIDYPQCCIVSGVKACCRSFTNNMLRATVKEADAEFDSVPRSNLA